MAPPDWLPEQNSESLPSSSDLFEGELFGDELIDIYNAAVGEGTADVDSNPNQNNAVAVRVPSGTDASTLQPQPKEGDDGRKVVKTEQEEALIADVETANAASSPIDDGLGAFRPSTSFNDLTTLLSPSTTTGVEAGSPEALSEGPEAVVEQGNSNGTGIKRESGTVPDEEPPSKRHAIDAGIKTEATPPSELGLKDAVAPSATADAAAPIPSLVASAPVTVAEAVGSALGKKKTSSSGPGNKAAVATTAAGKKSTKAGSKANGKKRGAKAPPETPSLEEETDLFDTSDFQSAAQAAVSSLILNTKTETSSNTDTNCDTSTKHIKELTGKNWVTACAGPVEAVVPPSAADAKSSNRAKKHLSADERARQNRDRNREHARNTRLRKKAYVEELKKTLTELVAQRDLADLEKRQVAQREVEQREVRFRVVEEFLKISGRNEPNFARWDAILEDGFRFTLPETDFREMVNVEKRNKTDKSTNLEQVLSGVSEVMADSSNFAAFLQALGKDSYENNANAPISFHYHCDRNNFFMDGNSAVLEWTATSVGAVTKGASAELFVRGSIRACFSPASNKLTSASMMLDTGAILSQLHELIEGPKNVRNVEAAAAILDSIQMPQLNNALAASVPAAVAVSSSSAVSVTCSEKSFDESL